jgi:hypothetical protein
MTNAQNSHVFVRYRAKPDRVDENASLVRAVYAELAATQPEGFRYATFLLDDGVTFVHMAEVADGFEAPLPQLPAFQRFLEGIRDRCDEPPATFKPREQIGGYGF